MSKSFWGVIVAIILLFVGVVALSGNKTEAPGSKNSSAQPTQHITGQGTAGVTLIEYGDFECSACEAYEPTVEQVRAKYGDQIKFQFRNFPLSSIHKNAFAAARAAEAASLQNKFWEMHNMLYAAANWQTWTTTSDPIPYFNSYANQLGLNEAKFKADFASSRVNDTVNADMAAGNKLGITGTPTFFLDGKKIEVNNDFAAFVKIIDGEIAKKAAQ